MLKLFCLLSFVSVAQSTIKANPTVGDCLSKLVTKELSVAYNYLQLSSKFGSTDGFPGFASLFVKLSDEHSSKAHDLTKLLAKRQFPIDRLIHRDGIEIPEILLKKDPPFTFDDRLGVAQKYNGEAWSTVIDCHGEANNANDVHIQDYLESNFLEHHIEVDKLFSDIDHRLKGTSENERPLTKFMIDEELLQSYGDRRKNIFE